MSAGKGKKIKKFMVHSSYATKSSKYMQSALKDDWKEGQEKRVNPSDYEAETLEGYIDWLYTKDVTLVNAEKECISHEPSRSRGRQDSDCSFLHCLKLAKMYTLGDYLNDMRFCNAVIDAMVLMRDCYPGPDAVQWVWSKTMEGCPVRKHILERWAAILRHEDIAGYIKKHSSKLPKDFLIDLLTTVGADHRSDILRVATARRALKEKCKFNLHFDDSDKCS